jgi:hypothetical protein
MGKTGDVLGNTIVVHWRIVKHGGRAMDERVLVQDEPRFTGENKKYFGTHQK